MAGKIRIRGVTSCIRARGVVEHAYAGGWLKRAWKYLFQSLLVKFVETVAIGLFDRSRLPLARGLVVTIRRTNWQGWLSTR